MSVCVAACAHAGPLEEAGATTPARQPDGVFLDLAGRSPDPVPVAFASGHAAGPVAGSIVSLALPISRAEVQTLIHGYFRAFVGGDPAAFAPLFARGARRILDDGSAAELATSLERRLRAVDYTHLAFQSVAAYDDIRVTAFEDAPGGVRTTDGMRDGDVLVDVPVRVERANGVRVFGPRVAFVLRRPGARGAFQIASIREPDGPW